MGRTRQLNATPMRIAEIAPTVAEPAAGTTYFVVRLCEALAASGHDVRLLTVGGGEPLSVSGVRHTMLPPDYTRAPFVRKMGFSRQLRQALVHAAGEAEVVHSHGLWRMANVYPAKAAARQAKPFIISLHGTLAPHALEFSRHVKGAFWLALQGPAFRQAICLHVTSEQEYRDIRRAGARQPVALIPIGVDLPSEPTGRMPASEMRTVLYFGRLHPIKGVDVLLQAWRRVAPSAAEWKLRIVGPEELGYRAQLERLVRDLSIPRIEFSGPRFGNERNAEYRNAELCVLPSRTENFGMTVAEALAHCTPVITTTGTPWAGLLEHQCGWFVDQTVEAIEAALRSALSLGPESLAGMGRAGRTWMARDFAWEPVRQKMDACYRWLVSGGTAPDFVRFD